MSAGSRCGMLGLVMLAASGIQAAFGGMVTVEAKNKSGSPADEAVVIFDPLDASPAPTHASAIVDQVHKRFVPRVSVIRTGTAVSFPNSDNIRHQVYSFSTPRPFNLKLYAGSPRIEITFDKPGLVVLGCNIHDTMVAFVAVVDSPYFLKIPPSGTADLNIPPGRYRVRVWHSTLNTAAAPQEITVGAGPMALPLMLDLDPERETAAPWPE